MCEQQLVLALIKSHLWHSCCDGFLNLILDIVNAVKRLCAGNTGVVEEGSGLRCVGLGDGRASG